MSSMIVYNLNIVGVTIAPSKADSPLVVNANTVLPLALACQLLKSISRRHPKVSESLRRIKKEECSLGSAAQIGGDWRCWLTKKNLFSFFGAKRPDHPNRC
jgi:hypothetical protein